MTAKERTISLFQRASKLQVGLNSRQFLLLQWPQKGMYDCSQTVQWGHITEACITQPFVVCQQIYFAQQFIVECWQFGCKSPFCTRFVCLFAGRLVPTSTRSAKRSSSGLFHKTHKPQHQNTDEQSVSRTEQKKYLCIFIKLLALYYHSFSQKQHRHFFVSFQLDSMSKKRE